jgi:hypothetical protein
MCYHPVFQLQRSENSNLGSRGNGENKPLKGHSASSRIISRYDQHRVFVPCDTVSTSVQLAGLIGAHIGLTSGKDLTGPVICHFLSGPPTLLILDNLETLWEPAESRAAVEKFLCLLADVEHLAFIVSTDSMYYVTWLTIILDHDARSRKTGKCAVDSALPRATEALGPECCSSDIH